MRLCLSIIYISEWQCQWHQAWRTLGDAKMLRHFEMLFIPDFLRFFNDAAPWTLPVLNKKNLFLWTTVFSLFFNRYQKSCFDMAMAKTSFKLVLNKGRRD